MAEKIDKFGLNAGMLSSLIKKVYAERRKLKRY